MVEEKKKAAAKKGAKKSVSKPQWSRWWSHGPSIWSGGNDCRSSGLGILLWGGNFTISEVKEVVGGRLLVANVMCNNAPLRLINVYAPLWVIQTAVRLLLPGELAKHAVSKGQRR
ncbi:histone H2B.2, sperm-like [Heterodontus francisci]|uniref:histone H2B.2, sperm-like n=1 Tax=Heterodontus francisci TaxID=7792 RepID=UPI00355B9307